jgi:hypothetical protein
MGREKDGLVCDRIYDCISLLGMFGSLLFCIAWWLGLGTPD